jgi:4-hydroxy-2-oxoheptanedioate aldolase
LSHPRVKEAERHVSQTALKKGIAPRAEIAKPDDAKKYLDMGVKHFCIGWDVSILFDWFKEAGRAMRQILGHDAGAGASSAGYGK